MPRERPRPARKRRTRAHIIADLSVHYVEGRILRCGFTAERVIHDYGVDLFMATYDARGEVEPEWVQFQLKATDRLKRNRDGTAIVFRLEHADLELWLKQTFPVIFVLYDAQADLAYWLYIQAHFAESKESQRSLGDSVTIRIPTENVLTEDAVRRFAAAKAAIIKQTEGIKHV